MLYSLNNQYPITKPFRIRMADSSTRTAEAVTEELLTEAGYTQVSDKPEDTLYQSAVWNGTNWVMTDKVIAVKINENLVAEKEWVDLQNPKTYDETWNMFVFKYVAEGKKEPNINYTYDSEHDVYITPKPYNSWTLNGSFDWEAPISYPTDGNRHSWNELTQAWDLITE